MLPAFAAALNDLELSESLDQELSAFLDAIHTANRERNSELRDELASAVDVLNRAEIEPVLLKGAIRLTDELYPDHGWRMLRDLDILVPAASLAKARRAFEKAGYAACGSGGQVRRRGGACQIDLHSELFPTPVQVRLLRAADMVEGARAVAFADGTVRVASVEHQLVHLIGHGQIRHFGHAPSGVFPCAIGWRSQRWCIGGKKPSTGRRFQRVLMRPAGRCCLCCSG